MARRNPGVYAYSTRSGTRLWRVESSANAVPISKRGFAREKEAADWLACRRSGVLRGYGLVDGRGKTLAEFVEDDWLPRYHAKVRREEIGARTVEEYERSLRRHVIPALGRMRLRDIGVEHVERLSDQLLGKQLSPDTVRRALNVLGYVLDLARRWRYVEWNVTRDAEKPKPRRRKPNIPPIAQVERVANATPTATERVLVLFAAFTGARRRALLGPPLGRRRSDRGRRARPHRPPVLERQAAGANEDGRWRARGASPHAASRHAARAVCLPAAR